MSTMNNTKIALVLCGMSLLACNKKSITLTVVEPVVQIPLARVEQMTNNPQPFKIIDFKELAKGYDQKVYDFNQTGKYWPLIWEDDSRMNFDQKVYGIYTAMGDARQGANNNEGMFHESLSSMGSILGASMMNIDKSNQNGIDYVKMLNNYFNKTNQWNIMMNNTCPKIALEGGGYARDWWYDVYPNVLYYGLMDFYPKESKENEALLRSIADKFYQADSVLQGNYEHSYFDYAKLKAHNSTICNQEDAAAGHAYVLYAAYQHFGDPKYLEGAKSSLGALLNLKENRFYEILMPFGAYTAARLNAEEGCNYDYTPILNWTFDGTSVCREGWGVLVDQWNGYDISGLVGSTVDHGGFAFLMNTYDVMWPLVPMVRYDQRYASAIGKWMLNASNASRLFYPYEIPDEHQTIPEEKEMTKGVIAYEGLIKKAHYPQYEHIAAPVAIGDGMHWNPKNPKVSQFSVYGSGHVGIAGAIISKTNVPNILQLDLLASDLYRKEALASFLYYNPNDDAKSVEIELGPKNVMVYNTITHQFLNTQTKGKFSFKLDALQSAILVIVPGDAKITESNHKLYANDIVIDYRYF